MSCELCKKNVYFDTSWYHSDGGYGDDDYGGVDRHLVCARICPNCGKIKMVDNKEISEAEKRKFVVDKLADIIANNMPYILENTNNEKIILDKVVTILEKGKIRYYNELLANNGLTYKDNAIFCSCGEQICVGLGLENTVEKLLTSKFNFCSVCGKKLKPLEKEIEVENDTVEFIAETKTTWDRRNRG